MTTELTKEMCIDLVKGCGGPHYRLFSQMEKYGSYNDNRGWQWNDSELEKLPESHLMEIYSKCKKSWK